MNLLAYKDYLVTWIQEQVKSANMDGVIIGLSGGVDSSVVAAIAKQAFPDNSLGVIMPIGDMKQDKLDALAVAASIDLDITTIDLSAAFTAMHQALDVKSKLAVANIKPRLRMTTLYALAQEKKYLVLGTDNAAEWLLGYFTKYGDGGVDLLPIIHFTKREVKKLAELLQLPEIIYTKAPTAGLWDNQTDEEELGFSYDKVDDFIENKTVDKAIEAKIKKQIKVTEHKRQPLPTPKSRQEL